MLEEYRYKDKKKLRCGYTTGSCAAAAAKAAAQMLLDGNRIEAVELTTPGGVLLRLPLYGVRQQNGAVTCGVKKDAGDDADVTDGIMIYATVRKTDQGICLDAGEGIGRVTREGLQQKPGQPAINQGPQNMIRQAVEEISDRYGYEGGFEILLSVPEGKQIAEKTFNSRLGIKDGISILGSTGIVEPMSEAALVETIRLELQVKAAAGIRDVMVAPGNYGKDFASEQLGIDLDICVKCSNFIGDTLDMACQMDFRSLLLIGHIGKLVKIGAGVMNTHSRFADARMETLTACLLQAGGDAQMGRQILGCVTTDEALEILKTAGMTEAVMNVLMNKIEAHLNHRTGRELETGVILFSNKYGLLGQTQNADILLKRFRDRSTDQEGR
ncbi:cobalt-precorrin-5B (C(1))-methyltransferase CbiD [Diplocloster modestus]|uniref:Cobalt-precorrin-5B C(1)-methyltransferase n=1 Tax=Diplocloster modestus TaxID=2850322 RepID=A0ABS6K6E2_9FIRM|nr:cobalt-precorrin-5B (C(1))-methyltransferase CbiD [Diplocloster modestus]MBU9726063.1 cobalt-precorrin-5B (C(1))-methyltransferase CbiD [Diplocloster modestus]